MNYKILLCSDDETTIDILDRNLNNEYSMKCCYSAEDLSSSSISFSPDIVFIEASLFYEDQEILNNFLFNNGNIFPVFMIDYNFDAIKLSALLSKVQYEILLKPINTYYLADLMKGCISIITAGNGFINNKIENL